MSGGEPPQQEVNLADYSDKDLTAELVEAARYGEDEDIELIGKILSYKGELVDGTDGQGRTALHMACANGHAKVVKMLLEREVKPKLDATNEEGNTPLHFAAINGSKEIVKALLIAGYNITARNKFDRKPIDEAWDRKNTEVEDVLLLKDPDVEAELKKHESKINPGDLKDMDAPPQNQSPKKPVSTSIPSTSSSSAEKTEETAKKPNEKVSMMDME
eukprot:TRINITY_DN3119_c1_g2_i1.p1 TRINITY_DN3119_c1_g2~~TRINITY_DN3119_c1_g2_i1.p1  ORF type:complete len:224 (+),score=74.31 TRINITY_DN3119_c1_g2_i1:23-673(+)